MNINDVNKIDPFELNLALRTACKRTIEGLKQRKSTLVVAPAALLAVLDLTNTANIANDDYLIGVKNTKISIIYAAARAWLTAGGTLEIM